MRHFSSALGWTAAALTLVVLLGIPVLYPTFTKAVGAAGVEVDPVYTGGDVALTVPRGSYRIEIHRPVYPGGLLPRAEPFVQVVWRPASSLPARIADEVDLDGDGKPELRASFSLPADPRAPLEADVASLAPWVRTTGRVTRQGFDTLIARVGDSVVLRVPVQGER